MSTSSTTSAGKAMMPTFTPLHTNTVSMHPTADGTAYQCLSRITMGTSLMSMSLIRPPPNAVNMPRKIAVVPDMWYIMALLVPLTAYNPSASASNDSMDHLSLLISGCATATVTAANSAVITSPLSETPAGGSAPSSTSRMMPPPNAVSHVVTRIAKTSYPLRTAASPPTIPQQNVARYSMPMKNPLLSRATSISPPPSQGSFMQLQKYHSPQVPYHHKRAGGRYMHRTTRPAFRPSLRSYDVYTALRRSTRCQETVLAEISRPSTSSCADPRSRRAECRAAGCAGRR